MAYAYLISPLNLPPLIFRFQFNPDILNLKKSFKYDAANTFGLWKFDKAEAGGAPGGIAGAAGGFLGTLDDFKEWGTLFTKVKPIEAKEGEPQTLSLEFKLDASPSATTLEETPELPGTDRPEGSLLDTIAVLQSFMYPSYDVLDIFKTVAKGKPPCLGRPPECTFIFGQLSLMGHITDLGIKVTAFNSSGNPIRADVSITLKEQSFAIGTISQSVAPSIATPASSRAAAPGRTSSPA
jgi:hypothetical protein